MELSIKITQADMQRAIRAAKKEGATRVTINNGELIFDLSVPDEVSSVDQSNNNGEWNDYEDEEDEE